MTLAPLRKVAGGGKWQFLRSLPANRCGKPAPLTYVEKRTKNDNESAHQTQERLPTDCLCDARLSGLALYQLFSLPVGAWRNSHSFGQLQRALRSRSQRDRF